MGQVGELITRQPGDPLRGMGLSPGIIASGGGNPRPPGFSPEHDGSLNEVVISACGRYRHSLLARTGGDETKQVAFIMLNPSTADATQDDPTIRRCKDFATTWGFGWLAVVNLFDWRATNPDELKRAYAPSSVVNPCHILAAAQCSSMVICAWGTKGTLHGQDRAVLGMLARAGVETHALAITKDGHPSHPLYLRRDTKPVVFAGDWA